MCLISVDQDTCKIYMKSVNYNLCKNGVLTECVVYGKCYMLHCYYHIILYCMVLSLSGFIWVRGAKGGIPPYIYLPS